MLPMVILYVLIGFLMIGLALPLIAGKVPPNSWYGFRIRLTLDSSEIWYPANRYAGWLLLIVGIVTVAVAVLLVVIPGIAVEHYALLVSGIMLASLLLCLILSLRYARDLAAGGVHSAVRGPGQDHGS